MSGTKENLTKLTNEFLLLLEELKGLGKNLCIVIMLIMMILILILIQNKNILEKKLKKKLFYLKIK